MDGSQGPAAGSHEGQYGRVADEGQQPQAVMLDTAAPWTSPWLPPGYEHNFWNTAFNVIAGARAVG